MSVCPIEELLSVRITCRPRLLEKLLDVLASLDFPINPQLYHDAATISSAPGGKTLVEPATIVEFPAWSSRLPLVREALERGGFSEACLAARSMIEDMHSDSGAEPAPPGAPYKAIVRWKHTLPATA
ncbi:MAG: hypothetical protein ACM336_17490 [Acidobacteriota bacterium]